MSPNRAPDRRVADPSLAPPVSRRSACNIGGVPVHPVRLDELLEWMAAVITARKQATVMYANAYMVNLAYSNPAFRDAIHRADLVFCDGHGVRLASLLLGTPLPERLTPPDWIPALATFCAQQDYRLFLLGGRPSVAGHAATRLRTGFSGLQITTHHGYFDPQSVENEAVLWQINATAPDVLLVGMGMPRQERWIIENLPCHSVPVTIAVGALFDYLAGQRARGPRWLTDHGGEWLCRLWFEPRRLWRRYLLGNPRFAWLVLHEWAQRRGLAPSRHAEN
ncbi:MAG: WecB/TagA/CpsF family glycosyltransferase [Ardenticatenaceae bacterium]